MKKLFKSLAVVLALMLAAASLVSCSAPSEPGQGKNKKTKYELYISAGGEKTEPHSVLRYIQSYNEATDQWTAADGMGMFSSPSEYIYGHEDSIPAVNSKNVTIDLSSNGKLSKVEIYGKADLLDVYELAESITLGETDIFADAEKAFSSLPEGTHYVVLTVSYKGDFIESDTGGRYEGSGYTYYFKIVT